MTTNKATIAKTEAFDRGATVQQADAGDRPLPKGKIIGSSKQPIYKGITNRTANGKPLPAPFKK